MSSLPAPILTALEQRDLEAAETLACTHVEGHPEAGPVWAILAVLSAQRGNVPEALERNQRALDCQPGDAGTWLNHGNLEKLAGRMDPARKAYEMALRCNPKLTDAVFNLGVLAGEESHSADAEKDYRKALQLDPKHAGALYNLARELSHRENAADVHASEVVELYRTTLEQNALWPEAWRNLGNFLRELGRDAEAVFAYEKLLQLQPDDKTTAHLLSALRGESPPSAIPGYVTQLFDRFAESYDEELSAGLRYEGAHRLAELVRTDLPDRALHILDLGCGTGLFLESLAPENATTIGVDLSPAMIQKAEARGNYQSCEISDIGSYLESCSSKFDLIAAADVFVYLGDLTSVFARVAGALTAEGFFAFTVESWPDAGEKDRFELQRSGRYRHGAEYLRDLAERSRLEVIHWETASLRREKNEVLSGEYVVLRRR